MTIAEPDVIAPTLRPSLSDEAGEPSSLDSSRNSRQHRVKVSRRLSGRPAAQRSTSSLQSITSQGSLASNFKLDGDAQARVAENASSRRDHHESQGGLIAKVVEWLQDEKMKRALRKSQSKRHPYSSSASPTPVLENVQGGQALGGPHARARSPSEASDGVQALDRLERILADNIALGDDKKLTPTNERQGSYFPRRHPSSIRKLRKGSNAVSSDTEYQDGDALIPTAEVILDNSKTLGYTGDVAESDTDLHGRSKRAVKEKEGWINFKNEIVRLAHTLRLKGWRRIPLDCGADIEVERLSGALTNAVYVVSPPKNLPGETPSDIQGSTVSLVPKKPPP